MFKISGMKSDQVTLNLPKKALFFCHASFFPPIFHKCVVKNEVFFTGLPTLISNIHTDWLKITVAVFLKLEVNHKDTFDVK